MRPIHAGNTEIFYGNSPQDAGNGDVNFTLDGEHLSLSKRAKFRYGDKKKFVAILFEGYADADRLCPYFSLASRPYTVTQLKRDKIIFDIKTRASNDEIKAVEQAGCMVTDKPDFKKIDWKKRKRRPGGRRR
jgi:hypothetical protein